VCVREGRFQCTETPSVLRTDALCCVLVLCAFVVWLCCESEHIAHTQQTHRSYTTDTSLIHNRRLCMGDVYRYVKDVYRYVSDVYRYVSEV